MEGLAVCDKNHGAGRRRSDSGQLQVRPGQTGLKYRSWPASFLLKRKTRCTSAEHLQQPDVSTRA